MSDIVLTILSYKDVILIHWMWTMSNKFNWEYKNAKQLPGNQKLIMTTLISQQEFYHGHFLETSDQCLNF